MHAKRLSVLLTTSFAVAALLLPLSAAAHAQAFAAPSAPEAVAQPASARLTPYDQGYKDGYRDGLVYARDCVRGDPRGRSGKPGASADYNRGYVAGIVAAYRSVHRTHCGFGPR
ncbi:hypothetical protein [Streptomyces sp. NPDC048385]|uniref:hypothetical protein n=1 Tax=Streptomyces sp. NPDC048385 TaxID=3155145 RepID=UPI003433F38E